MADSLRVHFDRRPGGLGKVMCLNGYGLVESDPDHPAPPRPDPSKPCPLCNSTAAAAEAAKKAERAAWVQILLLLCPPTLPTQQEATESTRERKVWTDDDREIDTTGFTVIRVPEGVVPKVNREGYIVRKGGEVVMETVDFRSDQAVTRRMLGGSSKWGRGNVTGSTSVCSTWAVPARPFSDSMASSDEIVKDLRSADMHDNRARQRKTPRRGARQPHKTNVVRRYTI